MVLCNKKPLDDQGVSFWSKRRESNPPSKLGKLVYYRCTTPAYGSEERSLQTVFN